MDCVVTVVAEYPAAAFFALVLDGIAVVADIVAAFFAGNGVFHWQNSIAYLAVCCCFMKIHSAPQIYSLTGVHARPICDAGTRPGIPP